MRVWWIVFFPVFSQPIASLPLIAFGNAIPGFSEEFMGYPMIGLFLCELVFFNMRIVD